MNIQVDGIYGDMQVIDINRTNKARPTVLLRCQVCGHERTVGLYKFGDGAGHDHVSCMMDIQRRCPKELKIALKKFQGVYHSAEQRCNNPNVANYKNYGGRGIQFRFSSFIEFYRTLWTSYLELPGGSLERVDNNGHYSPDNCTWVTKKQQARNRRSNIAIRVVHKKTQEELQYESIAQFLEDQGFPKTAAIAYQIVNQENRSYRGWRIYSC